MSVHSEIENPVGNAAALREALIAIRKALLLDSGMGPSTAFHAEVDRLTVAALSAPPRNCDRFRNADEALEALERHCNSSGNGCVRCPVAGCSTEEVECKIAWLFALAEGQEGSAK